MADRSVGRYAPNRNTNHISYSRRTVSVAGSLVKPMQTVIEGCVVDICVKCTIQMFGYDNPLLFSVEFINFILKVDSCHFLLLYSFKFSNVGQYR